MAEVKDFSLYADKKNNNTDRAPEPSYREKIRNHRMLVLFRTVAIVAIAVVAVAIIYVSWKDKNYTEAVISKSVKISDASSSKIINLNGHILMYSKDGVSLVGSNGDSMWNLTYEMQNPISRVCEDVVAIGDYNGHLIYVANTDGEMGEIDTNLPIRDFCVASQGVVAVILDDTDITWIYLYDSKGNELANFKTTMADSGYPLGVAISPNGELVCVSYLYPQDGELKTSIAFYNFGSVGQNAIDNYASGYDYPGVVVPFVHFLNSSTAFAVSDDRIMFFTGSEVPASSSEHLTGNDEIRSIYYDEDYVGLVFFNSTDKGEYRLEVYNTSGSKVMEKYFDVEYSDIFFDNGQIVVYSDSEIIIYGVDGADKYQGVFDQTVKAVIPTNIRSRFLMVTENSILTMDLK
ncbi:MAG: DUF5711 family protein [Butyrivibrio sp.]|nr:DUF5711 family protein [Butyrivibrio sp.]